MERFISNIRTQILSNDCVFQNKCHSIHIQMAKSKSVRYNLSAMTTFQMKIYGIQSSKRHLFVILIRWGISAMSHSFRTQITNDTITIKASVELQKQSDQFVHLPFKSLRLIYFIHIIKVLCQNAINVDMALKLWLFIYRLYEAHLLYWWRWFESNQCLYRMHD